MVKYNVDVLFISHIQIKEMRQRHKRLHFIKMFFNLPDIPIEPVMMKEKVLFVWRQYPSNNNIVFWIIDLWKTVWRYQGVIRSRKSKKDRYDDALENRDKNNGQQNTTQKPTDWATQIPLNIGGSLSFIILGSIWNNSDCVVFLEFSFY